MVVDGVAKNQSPTQKADGSPAAAAQTKPVWTIGYGRANRHAHICIVT